MIDAFGKFLSSFEAGFAGVFLYGGESCGDNATKFGKPKGRIKNPFTLISFFMSA